MLSKQWDLQQRNHLLHLAGILFPHIACTVLIRDVRYVISGILREVHENCTPYRRFGTTYRYHIENFKTGSIGCPETSVRNYHYSLRDKPEELSSLRKLRIKYRYFFLKVTNDIQVTLGLNHYVWELSCNEAEYPTAFTYICHQYANKT